MAAKNLLTLSVAGSRKTQGIIDDCAEAGRDERILILTYTTVNQGEIRRRLAKHAGDRPHIEVQGWYSFLIAHFVRPYVPYLFPGVRVAGFDNESKYQQGVPNDVRRRYFTPENMVRKVHLAHLSVLIDSQSGNRAVDRIARLFDRIYIDEAQDLGGYDLEILKLLFNADVDLRLVGDVRQATLSTNPEERKNKKFARMGIWEWFKEQERSGLLEVLQKRETFRCVPEIARFADSLFDSSWGFLPTISRNEVRTNHDGVFLLRDADVYKYNELYSPLGLRVRRNVGVNIPLEFMNFGEVKGLGRERIVINPTAAIKAFLMKGEPLEDQQAASLYVAVTRAEQSVSFILDKPGDCALPYWEPPEH